MPYAAPCGPGLSLWRAGVTLGLRLALGLGCAAIPFWASANGPDNTPPVTVSGLDSREIRAQLTPRRYTTLAAEIGAKVNGLPVPESGRFKEGQTLIRFDCSLQQAQLNKAKAALSAAEKVWRANQRLTELKSIGKLEVDMSEAEVLKARAEVDGNQAIISKCRIDAPYAGRIAEQKIREQQYVQPGQALLEILDDSALELEFIVPSRWLAWVQPEQGFQVKIDETGRSYPAKVTRIAARVDPVSQSVMLTGIIDGTFNELISGMSGRVLMVPPEGR
ncbi:efflux RND transporter periplasmic adaptor subunit [Pseudomonas sp. sp1636]|uniref:efflux RND transporter periplasmic adaptor subunit n=1 Tax=Pseudomonas sp. sp1636 TaxID=3036707 RepID=UPI0025A5755C|nr:efflux RND transporter periplasmic adaptor subunit [Pseudomonas sp. sp1636]MDM8349522.1 efflux RND transporter periplasmic adaptor subunit [Pseudomonas sp. sp1636]